MLVLNVMYALKIIFPLQFDELQQSVADPWPDNLKRGFYCYSTAENNSVMLLMTCHYKLGLYKARLKIKKLAQK